MKRDFFAEYKQRQGYEKLDQMTQVSLLAQELVPGRDKTKAQYQLKGWILKKNLDDYLQKQRDRYLKPLELEPQLSLQSLPAYSFAIQFDFKLRKPYLSKDEQNFYIMDNPVRKDKVFKLPYVAPSSWKGSLRSALRLERQLPNEESEKKDPIMIRLFGPVKEEPVFCIEKNQARFLTIDNLEYAAKRLSLDDIQQLLEKSRKYTLELPGGYGLKRRKMGTVSIIEAELASQQYRPFIPILAEPRTFMALIPADKAMEVVCAIKQKYECEMGKVRNRLPLHLGLVFFPRKTPLRAVLEAGRRMFSMAQSRKMQIWTLKEDVHVQNSQCTLQFNNEVRWRVSVVLGDGQTKDIWYPYFFIEKPGENAPKPQDRSLVFEGIRPTANDKTQSCWLVHAQELREGDQVWITPSLFDFEFLDTAGRRFEVFYDQDGRRRAPAKRNRPYLLDDLERFHKLWDWLKKGLSTAQIKQLDELIEAKREAWKQDTGLEPDRYDQTFKEFVCNALQNAGWKKGQKPDDQQMEALYRAALTGELHDLLELYMEILKEKPEADQQGGGK